MNLLPLRLAMELPAAAADLTLGTAMLRLTPAISAPSLPVLVIPGLLADDVTTAELRRYLTRCGHRVEPWGMGRNLGPTTSVMDGVLNRLAALRAETGQRVTLVGWSLGGIYARWLAHAVTDDVRQVIALGSPWSIPDTHKGLAALVFQMINTFRTTLINEVLSTSRQSLPVPSTAIYSLTDAIADWQHCVEIDNGDAESIQVEGSHMGLTHNPHVARAIAELLARPDRELEHQQQQQHRVAA